MSLGHWDLAQDLADTMAVVSRAPSRPIRATAQCLLQQSPSKLTSNNAACFFPSLGNPCATPRQSRSYLQVQASYTGILNTHHIVRPGRKSEPSPEVVKADAGSVISHNPPNARHLSPLR